MVHGRLPVRPPLFDVSGTLWHDGHPMPEALFALCEGRQRVEPCLRMGFMSSTLSTTSRAVPENGLYVIYARVSKHTGRRSPIYPCWMRWVASAAKVAATGWSPCS